MDRRLFLKSAFGASVVAGLGGCVNAQKSVGKRPNIVYVFADQLRYDVFSHRGDVRAKTPNFDRLAREGVSFDNAVTCMPVCAAYRASLFTGKYPTTHGMVINECCMNPNHKAIGYALHEGGYRMGYLGKWHLMDQKAAAIPPGPARLGFQYCHLWRAYNFNHANYKGYYWEDDEKGQPQRTELKGCQTPQWTDMAIDFINQSAGKEEPFALFLSYSPPHDPWSKDNVPEKYYEMFRNQDFPNPPNFSPDPDQYADRNKDPKAWKNKIVKELEEWRRCYYAMVAMLDEELGRLSDALKKAGIEDDTIFVYTSDHGEMFGAHGRMYKLTFYEEAAHIPFYVRWPGKISKNTSTDACLNTPDIAPTLLSMVGLPVPDEMEGQDLSAAALGRKGPEPDCALLQGVGHTFLWENGAEWRAVRDKRYTYAKYLIDGKEHLYDNQTDPYQKQNLAAVEAYQPQLEKMRKLLHQKMTDINDLFLPFTDYRDQFMAKDDAYSIVAGAQGPFKGPYSPIPSTRGKQK